MLFTILLAAVPAMATANTPAVLAQSIGEIVIFIWGSASLLIKLYELVSGRSKEKDKAANERLKKLEEECHNNTLKHTASQLEREKIMDTYNIRNQNVENTYNVRFQALENKMSQVDTLIVEVNGIKTRQEVQSTLIQSIDSKMNEMKSESSRQFDQVLYLLKDRGNK
ncbi:hypothetical protein [Hymenobacter sp. UYCo722]|uniref:hypothetical protein n=1 Tax=Hymenobacter sp. UYCo722 TaxID=3156335 RepID=UPI0033918BDA